MAYSLPGGVGTTTDAYQELPCLGGKKFAIQVLGQNPVDIGIARGSLGQSRDPVYGPTDTVLAGNASWSEVMDADAIRFRSHNPGLPSDITIAVFNANEAGDDPSVGAIGRPSYDWDGPALIAEPNKNVGTSYTSAVLDVRKYAGIQGIFLFLDQNAANNGWLVTFTWLGSPDPIVGPILGQVSYKVDTTLASNLTRQMIFALHNRGPYLRVTASGFGPSAAQHLEFFVFGTNRLFPQDSPPLDSLPLNNVQANILPGNNIFTPAFLGDGPAKMWIFATQPWFFSLDVFQLPGGVPTYNQYYGITTSGAAMAASAAGEWGVILPRGSWRLNVINNAGVNGVTTHSVSLSPTGSL